EGLHLFRTTRADIVKIWLLQEIVEVAPRAPNRAHHLTKFETDPENPLVMRRSDVAATSP
ncbi:hypothetical protein, partial [Actinopolymorpha sp. B9G3]|uniref:hypothetical protein n=1 Tax=Actinopolymorpha sp. B9G3 TaxID=3158970 RepID=UPI0032D918E2